MFYQPSNKTESQLKIQEEWLKLADHFKDYYPKLTIATYDRGTYEMPYVSKEDQEKIERTTKGAPHFVFFPKSYKEGIRYSFEYTFEFFKMFLKQKSPNI